MPQTWPHRSTDSSERCFNEQVKVHLYSKFILHFFAYAVNISDCMHIYYDAKVKGLYGWAAPR